MQLKDEDINGLCHTCTNALDKLGLKQEAFVLACMVEGMMAQGLSPLCQMRAVLRYMNTQLCVSPDTELALNAPVEV